MRYVISTGQLRALDLLRRLLAESRFSTFPLARKLRHRGHVEDFVAISEWHAVYVIRLTVHGTISIRPYAQHETGRPEMARIAQAVNAACGDRVRIWTHRCIRPAPDSDAPHAYLDEDVLHSHEALCSARRRRTGSRT